VDARAWLFGVARHTIMNTQRGAERRRALAVRLAKTPTTADGPADLVAQQVDLASPTPAPPEAPSTPPSPAATSPSGSPATTWPAAPRAPRSPSPTATAPQPR
jgi:DNA-directed RNA polymerase specialized sigma24 family protein